MENIVSCISMGDRKVSIMEIFSPRLPCPFPPEKNHLIIKKIRSFPSLQQSRKREVSQAPPVEEQTRLLSFLSASACSIQRIPVNKGEKL